MPLPKCHLHILLTMTLAVNGFLPDAIQRANLIYHFVSLAFVAEPYLPGLGGNLQVLCFHGFRSLL